MYKEAPPGYWYLISRYISGRTLQRKPRSGTGRLFSEGAVVGSVGSVDVPSQRGECGEGAVVGSVGSVDVVDDDCCLFCWACSRVALKCNAARLSANTFKLTPYMMVVQDDFEDSMDCKLRRNSDTGAHGCESRIAL